MKNGERYRLNFPHIPELHGVWCTCLEVPVNGGYYLVRLDDDTDWSVKEVFITLENFLTVGCGGSKEL